MDMAEVATTLEQMVDPYSGAVLKTIKLLGEGAMGQVFLVQGTYGGHTGQMACKVIKRNPQSRVFKEFVAKEFIASSRADTHANIVKQFGCFLDVENFYLVMEYCANDTLHSLIAYRKNTLNEIEVRYFGKAIIEGLDFLHYKKIAHRDIKPGNILLTEDMEIKICDFGISDFMFNGREHIQFVTGRVGSPNFIAPEALTGEKTPYDPMAADMWSFGCVMFTLAYGVPPFEKRGLGNKIDIQGTLSQGFRCMYQFPMDKDITQDLKNLIKSLLNLDANARPSSFSMKQSSYFQKFTPAKISKDVFRVQRSYEMERAEFNRAEALKRSSRLQNSRFIREEDLQCLI